jgi:NADPH:quinone reductase
MNAFVIDSPDARFRLATVADPTPRAGEVVVRVEACAVNPLDTKIRAGSAAHARQPLPAILGIDIAGEIVELGPGVTELAIGDHVLGMACGVDGIPGGLAERVAVDARLLARKPAALSFRDAAALPLVAITAWEGIVDQAAVKAGMNVLVQGGSGGVGYVAIQIAHALGATVWTIAGSERIAELERLGARPHLDADATHLDVVYDTAGGAALDAAFKRVGRGGHVVSCLGWGTHALAPLSFKAATYSGVFTLLPLLSGIGREHHGEILRRVIELGVRARIDPRRFDSRTIEQAFDAVAQRTANGKIVVERPAV